MTDFEYFKLDFIKWMYTHLEPARIGEYPVCPYAQFARRKDKIGFVDSRNGIVTTDLGNNEIVIHWLGDNIDVNEYTLLVEKLNKDNPLLLYLLSTPLSGHFVKNFTNCIFAQNRLDIESKRKYLKTTDYYNKWPVDYLKSIIES